MGICKAMEDMRNEAAREATEHTKIEAAINMLRRGKDSIEEIADILALPVEKVAELAQSRTA